MKSGAKKGFAASRAQRRKVYVLDCLSCGAPGPSDPAHLVSRAQGGCDDALCVVPLCRRCHAAFDHGRRDLSGLDDMMTPELQHALTHIPQLQRLLRRLTGKRESED